MSVSQVVHKNHAGLFRYLLYLTLIFLGLEISFFLQQSGFYFSDAKTISNHLAIPRTVLPGILVFIATQLLVHCLFPIIIWSLTVVFGMVIKARTQFIENLGFMLWGLALITVLCANQLYFPNSKFAGLTSTLLPDLLAGILLWIGIAVFAIICLIILYGITNYLFRSFKWIFISLALLMSVLILFGFEFSHKLFINHDTKQPYFSTPNIIIVGIDGLRPDALGYFDGANNTPHLDKLLNRSVVFGEALTPLARTFPAWVSLLTGQYPTHSGVRFDLADQHQLSFNNSLPSILRSKLGYETIFAMDETRFSNIEKNLGFDTLITPPVGFNDFLLGTFNDFPLSNLLINTQIGKWLFPYSYGNRPAFVTYDPDSFLALMNDELKKPRLKPVFLAVHFCLPHFPYFWSRYTFQQTTSGLAHYHKAVERTDQQVGDFLASLKQLGLLDNAIVVLLSDHGEALELSGDRITEADAYLPSVAAKTVPHFYPKSFELEAVNQSAGHGTDVLGLSQYHSVFAFTRYGVSIQPRLVPGLVSLLDLKATLLAMVGLKADQKQDGVSLAPIVLNDSETVIQNGHFFIESDFSPQAVRTVHPETRQLLFEGIDFFQIDPLTTKLTVKQDMGTIIISSKQYADVYKNWILALYPQPHGLYQAVLVNLSNGLWITDLTQPFAEKSPAKTMLSALRAFYNQPFLTTAPF
jgi:predicted AlkP superfamily pyrophosphatase or phosphodiesterase